VQIRGQYVRAGNKPLEGHLLIESNGGNVNVTVRLDVPPKAYPKACCWRHHAASDRRESVGCSEGMQRRFLKTGRSRSGSARWLDLSCPGAVASGVGAVQQFFEALGLAQGA